MTVRGQKPRTKGARTITRADLIEVVTAALVDVPTESTREKLLHVAQTTNAVAVGWFHCGSAQCPAAQAGRRNQVFQTAFDKAMAERFDRKWNEDLAIKPFVVRVVDERGGGL